jgi:hypothetical protein
MANRILLRQLRINVVCEVEYVSARFVGKGQVHDLSQKGLCIVGRHAANIGMRLSLSLHLPNEPELIQVALVSVHWFRGDQFGVRFERMTPKARERLCRFFLVEPSDLPLAS